MRFYRESAELSLRYLFQPSFSDGISLLSKL